MARCNHDPKRLYSWFAADGTLCVACCKCGEILKGAVIKKCKNILKSSLNMPDQHCKADA